MAARLKELIASWRRIVLLARKPDREEYTLLVRLTFLGFTLIGAIAYVIHLVTIMVIE